MKHFAVRFFALAEKEALHMVRDRQVVYLALGLPLVLVLLFGYAVSFDTENVRVFAIDRDRSKASRSFLARIHASDAFEIVDSPGGVGMEDEIEGRFRTGEIKAAFVIPPGFARAQARGDGARVQLVVDGADGTTARIVLAYANALALATQIDAIGGVDLGDAGKPTLPIEPRIRLWFNPRMESEVFVVPGLVAVVLAILAVLLSGLTVAREWERGSMEQLFATPVERLAIVLGKAAPYVLLGLLQFLLVLTAGAYLFDVPLRGSPFVLFASVLLFLIAALGQGIFISMVTRSQQLAVQLGAITSILPSLLISGFLFPVENMPLFLRLVSRIVPARYFVACLRGTLVEDRGLTELLPELVGLALLGGGIILVTARRFPRRID